VTIELKQYQMTQKYEFDMPIMIDASKLPFDRYEIRMQLGFSRVTVRSSMEEGKKNDDDHNPGRVEFDIPGVKLQVPGAQYKPYFYVFPSLIYKNYKSLYAKVVPKDLLAEYDIQRGSVSLSISRSASHKFPMAFCFVLLRKDIKAILSVIIPLYVLIAFPPLCQAFNNLLAYLTYLLTYLLPSLLTYLRVRSYCLPAPLPGVQQLVAERFR
jgi:hypothetical protein